MKNIYIFFVLSFISFYGCFQEVPPQYGNDITGKNNVDPRIFDLTYKSPFINEDLKIYLHSVSEDSRCPNGVNCIWAGQAVVNLKMNYQNGNFIYNNFIIPGLLFPPHPDTVQFHNYLVIVNNLEPYPKNGIIMDTLDYVVKLKIIKK